MRKKLCDVCEWERSFQGQTHVLQSIRQVRSFDYFMWKYRDSQREKREKDTFGSERGLCCLLGVLHSILNTTTGWDFDHLTTTAIIHRTLLYFTLLVLFYTNDRFNLYSPISLYNYYHYYWIQPCYLMGAVCCSQSSIDLDGEGMQPNPGQGVYGC